jgi:hypothetical protein
MIGFVLVLLRLIGLLLLDAGTHALVGCFPVLEVKNQPVVGFATAS